MKVFALPVTHLAFATAIAIAIAIQTTTVHALSTSSSEAATMAKSRLREALSSPSKKTTISPEIIIPEPSDATALLLQSTEVTKMSGILRTRAKANVAFVTGSMNMVKTFCTEQETARGNFPGPLPVVYCASTSSSSELDMEELADVGVAGVLYTVVNGDAISSVEEIQKDDTIQSLFQSAIENGVQLIPEVVLDAGVTWDEERTQTLVEALEELCGADPAAILLTPQPIQTEGDDDSEADGESDGDNGDSDGGDTSNTNTNSSTNSDEICEFPKVPKIKNIPPILGSIRARAGGGRMGSAVTSCKQSGLHGVILRCDCLPGYRMNPDLEFVGGFWGAAIGDLKSTKSKNFNFRTEVALERDVPMEWYNYQKDVMESGALGGGDAGNNPTDPVDSDSGDYKGF